MSHRYGLLSKHVHFIIFFHNGITRNFSKDVCYYQTKTENKQIIIVHAHVLGTILSLLLILKHLNCTMFLCELGATGVVQFNER